MGKAPSTNLQAPVKFQAPIFNEPGIQPRMHVNKHGLRRWAEPIDMAAILLNMTISRAGPHKAITAHKPNIIMNALKAILLIAVLLHTPNPYLFGQPMQDDSIKSTILSVQKEIVDLTDPVEPLRCKKFVAARTLMTSETAEQIIKLIQQGSLSGTQSEIGVILLSGLPEAAYLKTTEQLIAPTTQKDVLNALLMPPLPYGPGHANSCGKEDFKKKLVALKNNPACSRSVKTILDLIISGKALDTYSDYKEHPDRYGY